MNKEKLEKYTEQIDKSTVLNCKLAMFIAIILKERVELEQLQPTEICEMFGMSESYVHLVRTVFKIPMCMNYIGIKIARLGTKAN